MRRKGQMSCFGNWKCYGEVRDFGFVIVWVVGRQGGKNMYFVVLSRMAEFSFQFHWRTIAIVTANLKNFVSRVPGFSCRHQKPSQDQTIHRKWSQHAPKMHRSFTRQLVATLVVFWRLGSPKIWSRWEFENKFVKFQYCSYLWTCTWGHTTNRNNLRKE